eukprot:SAG11_NODE_6206_length_1365_cov_0.936019_2_plen_33_part_01
MLRRSRRRVHAALGNWWRGYRRAVKVDNAHPVL